MPFFGSFGNEVTFDDETDLLRKLAKADCSVPGRLSGRTKEHRESFCLKAYLLEPRCRERLTFPLTVRKRERPDFELISSAGAIGVEHADMGTSEYQERLTQAERPGEPEVWLIDPEGFVGDLPEQEWEDDLIKIICKKIHKLSNYSNAMVSSYELLVYDNSRSSNVIDFSQIPSLAKKAGDRIWEMCQNELNEVNVKRIWLVQGADSVIGVLGR
jgi:hypothetical protein